MNLQSCEFKYIVSTNYFNYKKYPLLYVLEQASNNIFNFNYKPYLRTLEFWGYDKLMLSVIEEYKDNNVTMCVLYNNYIKLAIHNNALLSTKEKNGYIDVLIKNNRIVNICKKFYFKIKKNLINKSKPINECELCSLDTYDKTNNNIYIYSNNKKWWFSISTMNTIISNYLASICSETLRNISKPICNPYTGEKLTYSQLYSVYFQLKKYNNVSNLFSLLQMCNFSYRQFITSSLAYIILHNHKKNIIHLNNEDLVTYFYNLI